METMRSNAAEYFRRLSPLKIETRKNSMSPPKESPTGRSGRCHCCPYGYHIDLDFVRYCQSLEKGSKSDNPAITKLKKLKKERRRETKSMEVMLGLKAVENGHDVLSSERSSTSINKRSGYIPSTLNAAGRKLTPAPRNSEKMSPPSPPPRKSSLTHPSLQSPPYPDIINSSSLVSSRRSEQAADALKEAVLNFEETLEYSQDSLKRQKTTNAVNLSSIDLLHHTPPYGQKGQKLTATVGRSNSLPRQYTNDFMSSRTMNHTWNTLPHPSSQYNQSPLISDAMSALEAARGYANPQPDLDTLSMVSGMSGVSTSTLQSIREHMATGLSRLKDLETEVKKVPAMQLKMDILKEQNRLLMEQTKAYRNGTEPPILPPVFDIDGDFSEDELETRLSLLRKRRERASSIGRKRSPSPLRVNLEDFRSYRRARASSMSEGSDTESVHSYHGDRSRERTDTRLFISETGDTERRLRKQTIGKRTRDVGVGCRVTTRDVGISNVAPRVRSIAIGTDRWETRDSKKEVAPKPCIQCLKLSQKTYEHKAIETMTLKNDSGRLSMSSVSLESIDPEDASSDDPKSNMLQKLGRKSALISRLSEPQLFPPALTFDNSTNTDPIHTREKKCNTTLAFDDIYTKPQLDDLIEEARLQWEKRFTARQSSKRPLTRDVGAQTIVETEAVKPKSFNIAIQCKPHTKDHGVNVTEHFEKPKTRSVAVEAIESKPLQRSVLTNTEPESKRMRTVSCGTSDHVRLSYRSIAVGDDRVSPDRTLTRHIGSQSKPSMRDIGTVTTHVSSLATTPETEKRPFGSTGVNVCDKCHEAITSVAKDIVGILPGASVPPPTNSSKIPRLVDQPKPEPIEQKPPPPKPLQESRSLPIPSIRKKSPSPPVQPDLGSHGVSSIPSLGESPQTHRIPYQRQETYTKHPQSGFENPAFEEFNLKPKRRSPSPPKRPSPKRSIPKPRLDHKPKTIREDSQEDVVANESVSKQSSSSSSSSAEDSGDETMASPAPSVRSGTYSITSVNTSLPPLSQQSSSSAIVGPDGKTRKKSVPSRNMRAALKVLNDSIGKPSRSGQQLTNAVNIVQKEWFKVSSDKNCNPVVVEEYMDAFEDYSRGLLQRVVNLADTNGNTAMHYAVSGGNFDVVSVLLDSKVCNINQQNKAGYTASMLVALAPIKNEAQESVVNRLFQLGDVNIKASQHGQTALMLAVSHGRLDMVRMLISAGADVNIQDEDGSTALMCAAEHGHLAIVKYLSAQPDTDLYLMDNDGSTALTIAVEAGHKDVGVLLYKQMNLSRVSSPYSSVRVKRSRTPTLHRPPITPPPRNSAPPSPGRSRKSSGRVSPRQSSASLSNLMI